MMIHSETVQNVELIRCLLRTALEVATHCEERVVWGQLAQTLGVVRLRLRDLGAAPDDTPAALPPPYRGAARILSEREALIERVVEDLTLADMLSEREAALALNCALVKLSGTGIVPVEPGDLFGESAH